MWRVAENIPFKIFYWTTKPRISTERIQIPEFQRNYVWKTDKVKELLDSIYENENGYYIWNIVSIKSNSWTSGREKILDWQQRLITLCLVFIAIFHKSSDPHIKNRVKQYIYDSSWSKRIEFSKNNLETIFLQILNSWSFTWTLDSSQKKISDIYDYIFNVFLVQHSDYDILIEKIENVEFVVMNCETEDEVYQIFEWLNSTWLSLWQTDLIKSSILNRINILDSSKIQEIYNSWKDIEYSFEVSSTQNIFIKFIRQQAFGSLGYISMGWLFKKIKQFKISDSSIIDIETYLLELMEDSEIYLKLRLWDTTLTAGFTWMPVQDKIDLWFVISWFRELWLDQIYSLLLALIKYWNINNHYFRWSLMSDFKKLYAFFFLAKYTKISPASYERKLASICKNIVWKSYPDFKIEMGALFSHLNSLLAWINEDVFIENFTKKFSWKNYSEVFINSIFKDIYWLPKLETLEHIVPKEYLTYWNTVISWLKKREINKLINSIWNLTTLESPINSTIGDREFTFKKLHWYDKSALTNVMADVVSYDFNKDIETVINTRWEFIAKKIYDYYITT